MKKGRSIRTRRREAGIALLISIFILLLISVVAIAMLVSSGTESALAGNYRSSTSVYYAALSGLEEARSRLLGNNLSSFRRTAPPGFVPAPGTTMPIGTISYVLNPSPDPSFGENLGNLLALYPDLEYDAEFGAGRLAAANGAGTVQTTRSVWNAPPLNAANGTMGGPLYKWVRINPISETALNLDVSPFDTAIDPLKPVFYDCELGVLNDKNIGQQVFEITSLAVLPNGSQKVLQYLVAPTLITLPPFPAALMLSGSNGNDPKFQPPANNAQYAVKGDDQDCAGNPSGLAPSIAVGIFGDYSGGSSTPAVTNAINNIPYAIQQNYTGSALAPDVTYLNSFLANMQTPSQLDAIAQTILQNADAVVPQGSTSTQTAYLSSLVMSPSKIQTVVANGNLDVSNWGGTGYGLLLVTGEFTYDPDTTWNGVVLVIGQGKVVNTQNRQFKQINGVVFVAKTRDASGNLLPNLGGADVSFLNIMQGNGIRYSSCWIQRSQPTTAYRILSFHDIPQP